MLSVLFIYFYHYYDSKTLGFIYFVGLKNTQVDIGLCGPMSSSGLTSQNKSGPSKVTPPKGMWHAQKTAPDIM